MQNVWNLTNACNKRVECKPCLLSPDVRLFLLEDFASLLFEKSSNPYSIRRFHVLTSSCSANLLTWIEGATAMEWVTPQHEEIDLNCEVSSYANAEL